MVTYINKNTRAKYAGDVLDNAPKKVQNGSVYFAMAEGKYYMYDAENEQWWEQMDNGSGGGSGGTTDHTKLTNRSKPNQHPIEAITGLREELDGKASVENALPPIGPEDEGKVLTAKGKRYELKRPVEGSHYGLRYLDLPDQHPASAVNGLTESLGIRTIKGKNLINDSVFAGMEFTDFARIISAGETETTIDGKRAKGVRIPLHNNHALSGPNVYGRIWVEEIGHFAADNTPITFVYVDSECKEVGRAKINAYVTPQQATSAVAVVIVLTTPAEDAGITQYAGKHLTGICVSQLSTPIQYFPFSDTLAYPEVNNLRAELKMKGVTVRNYIDDIFYAGMSFDDFIVLCDSGFAVAPNNAAVSQVEFAIDESLIITDKTKLVCNVWLTDGTNIKAVPLACSYIGADGNQIDYYGTGNVVYEAAPVTGAVKIKLFTGVQASAPQFDKFRGKIIKGISLTYPEFGDSYQPGKNYKKSEKLEEIDRRLNHLEGGAEITSTDFGERYAKALMQASDETYQCLFFTDPHPWSTASVTLKKSERAAFVQMEAEFKRSAFTDVICGGDWMGWNSNLTAERAFTEEMVTHGYMEDIFKSFKPAVGNHEYAFYTSGGILTDAQIRDAMMPEYKKLWYSYEAANNKVIALNTGENPNIPISEEQKDFLRAELTSAEKNVIVVCHIVYDGADVDTAKIAPVYQSILDILDAYNNREAPFQSARHKVLCTLAGHMHAYMQHTSPTGIISIAFDKLVGDRDKLQHFYGLIIDNANRKLTAIQSTGPNLTYNLPEA